jgi:hypothetical protein
VFPKGDTALVLDSKRAGDLALLQQAQARVNQKRYGGLPGGPHEMPCMNCGGYMDMGGYNSPTNYGSFSVPMDMGGEEDSNDPPKFVPLSKKDSTAVAEKLKYIDRRYPENKYEFLFTDTTETDIRPFNKKLNKFERLSDNLQWDPKKRLFGDNEKWINHKAMQEKLARQAAKKNEPSLRPSPFAETWNLLKRQEEERLRRAAEQKEYGGILDASNNQDYPIMDMGGMDEYASGGNYESLRSFLKTVSKAEKKAFGGDKTMQGGNQSFRDERNNAFKNLIQRNVHNSFVDQEEEENLKMAKNGINWKDDKGESFDYNSPSAMSWLNELRKLSPGESDEQLLNSAGFRKYSDENTTTTGDNSKKPYSYDNSSIAGLFKQFAQDFGPQSNVQGYNNFPANFRNYWQMNKAGRESINNLPENFQLGNVKGTLKYGPLGRTWLGKKLGVGFKGVDFELSGTSNWKNTPYKQGPQVQLADPNNPLFKPYSQYNTGAPEGTLQTNKGSFAPLDFNLGVQKTMGYGGLYKAVEGVGTPISMGQGVALKGTAPGGTSLDSLYSLPVASSISTPANVEQMKKQAGRETEQMYKTERQGETGTSDVKAAGSINKDYSGLATMLGQYADPGLNILSNMIEAPGQKRREQQALLENRTPGSDKGPFVVNTASAPNIGDYDQWGNFRLNQKGAGPMYGEYGGMFEQGGFYEEGEEYDLTPEEIEELRAQGYVIEELD